MKKCGLRMAQGGIVRGKGGPTDDMVPMKVAGKNVNLSDTEAVLPAKTVQALGGPEAVEALIEQTNGMAPVRGGLREGGSYYGGVVDDFGDYRARTPSNTGIDAQAKAVIRAQQAAAMNAPSTPAEINYAPRSTVPVQDGVRMGTPNPPPRPNFEHVSRAVVPYNPQEIPSGTPRNAAFQDGLRTGAQPQTGRPNWTDPTRQVAPVYDASTAGSRSGHIGPAANVIDSTAQRVPNGSDRALVPTNGQAQFHDKISAEEMARGNQNRAAAFQAADEAKIKAYDDEVRARAQGLRAERASAPQATTTADAPKPAEAPKPTAPAQKPQGLMAKAGKLAGYTGAATGVYDMMAADSNSEKMVGAVKTLAALPHFVPKVIGNAAAYGDMAVQGLTGTSIGKHLDDYFDPKKPDAMTQAAPTVKQAQAEEAVTKPQALPAPSVTQPQAQAQPAVATIPEAEKNAGKQKQAEDALLSSQGLGRNLEFQGNKDATGYTIAPDARGGVITRAPDANGLRRTTYLSGAPSAADAARDAQFAQAGYGKDAYGNWMTPTRIADKEKLVAMQRPVVGAPAAILGGGSGGMGADRGALLKQLMTPHKGSQNGQLTLGQMNAARGVLGDVHGEQLRQQELAQNANLRQQELGQKRASGLQDPRQADFKTTLDLAKFDQEERKMRNLQGNNERDHEQKLANKDRERIDTILKARAGDDTKRFAQLKAYEANIRHKEGTPKPGTEEYYKFIDDNLAIDELFAADEGGWTRSVGQMGSDPVRGLRREQSFWGRTSYVDPNTGRQISASEYAKLPPSARALFKERLDPNYQ